MYPHITPKLHIRHALRRNEDELPRHTSACSLDHHLHANIAIHIIHEDVKFVKAADRRSHGFPEREKKADRAEGLLASAKRLGLTAGGRGAGNVGLDL